MSNTANVEKLNPNVINALKAAVGGKKFKAVSSDSFQGFLGAANAMSSAGVASGQLWGGPKAATVLSAAFSGFGAAQSLGGGTSAPYLATGTSPSYTGGSIGYGGLSDANSSVVPGTDGFSQMDLLNSMNQNNLQLLELQAVMQNNMQAWNTKSNILSADHRARMTMIEKFAARG